VRHRPQRAIDSTNLTIHDVEMVRQALYLVVNDEDGDDTVNRIITALRAGQTALAIAKGTKRKLEENEGSEK